MDLYGESRQLPRGSNFSDTEIEVLVAEVVPEHSFLPHGLSRPPE